MVYYWTWDFVVGESVTTAEVFAKSRPEAIGKVMELTGLPATHDDVNMGQWVLKKVDVVPADSIEKYLELEALYGKSDGDSSGAHS